MYCIESGNIPGFSESGYYFQRTEGRKLSSKQHSHNFYEFLYIASGECVHKRGNNRECLFLGDLICISPGVSHCFISQTEGSDVIALSVVSEEMKIFFDIYNLKGFQEKSFVLNLSMEKTRVLAERCDGISYENNNEYLTQMRMILNQIFLFATEPQYKKSNIPAEFFKVTEKMKNLENASKGISSFLSLSGYSHSQLCRLTKKHMGVTPTEYINRIRMGYAYDMIVHSDKDYETICETVGFESFSYFCRLLKEHFGCSAAKLRKGTEIMRRTL